MAPVSSATSLPVRRLGHGRARCWLVATMASSVDVGSYGALFSGEAGDAPCDDLYWQSPLGSEYESFGASCVGRSCGS